MQLVVKLDLGNHYHSFNESTVLAALPHLEVPESSEREDAMWRQSRDGILANSELIEIDTDAPLEELIEQIFERFSLPGQENIRNIFDRTKHHHERPFDFRRASIDLQTTSADKQTIVAVDYIRLTHYPVGRELFRFPSSTLRPSGIQNAPDLNITLAELNIGPSDVILMEAAYDDGAHYCMVGVPDVDSFQRHVVAKVEEFNRILRSPLLCGTLLYTDEDLELVRYVKTNFTSLSALAGEYLNIYVVERPTLAADLQYWRNALRVEAYQLLGLAGVLKHIPYSRHHSYEIATRLGVSAKHLPCLVVFDYLERPNKLIFPIHEVTPKYFRNLFSELTRIVSSKVPHPSRIPHDRNLIDMIPDLELHNYDHRASGVNLSLADTFERVRRSYVEIVNSLEVTKHDGQPCYMFHGAMVFISNLHSEVSVSEKFIFNHETTFINRPKNSIIQDFQNKHQIDADGENAPILQNLSRLMELVVASTELADIDREDGLRAIDLTATEVRHGNADRITVKGRLQVLKEMLIDAADIATPALAVVSALMAAFGLS